VAGHCEEGHETETIICGEYWYWYIC